MAINSILETLISLAFVYAFLSILVSVLSEWWNDRTKQRGIFLQRNIFKLLDDPLNMNYGYLLYLHPLVDKTKKDAKSLPYYISAENFAMALIDVIAKQGVKTSYKRNDDGTFTSVIEGDDKPLFEKFKAGLDDMCQSDLKLLLKSFYENSINGDSVKGLKKLEEELARWYNDHMDRLSGQYKKGNQKTVRNIAFAVAIFMNIDSIHLLRVINTDDELKSSLLKQAYVAADAWQNNNDSVLNNKYMAVVDSLMKTKDTSTVKAHNLVAAEKVLAKMKEESDSLDGLKVEQAQKMIGLIESYKLPIGWNFEQAPLVWFSRDTTTGTSSCCGADKKTTTAKSKPTKPEKKLSYLEARNKLTFWNVVIYLLGIIITGYSLSFGAPFWFELMVKLVNIRRAGTKPEGSQKK